MKKIIFLFIFLFSYLLPSPSSIYKTINPTSIKKHLIFYELYPNTKEGQKALKKAYSLLSKNLELKKDVTLPKIDLQNLIQMIINPSYSLPKIKEEDLEVIKKISSNLKNRSLKTYNSFEENTFINTTPEEIDLARAILVAQNPNSKTKIKYYEAIIDLIALQILANLKKNPSPEEIIKKINNFIFFEMGFRFPPTSQYASEIDTYTSLPSVLDKKKGVCLGLSILYLSISQRLGVKLEPITPPGHIYLSYRDENNNVLNIETTARGIHVNSEDYLNIETKKLQKRNLKEVIGLSFINEASLHLKDKNYKKANSLYKKAKKYLPNDPLLKELLGFSYIFMDKEKKGKILLREIENISSPFSTTKDSLVSDFLNNLVDKKGIQIIFESFEDTKESITKKIKELEKILKKYPKFRMGLLFLANTYLKLGRTKEAFYILLKYQKIDPLDPLINFYLSMLSFRRFDFLNSWKYLKNTEKILKEKNYYPKILKSFKKNLTKICLN